MAADNGVHFPEVGSRFVNTGQVQEGRIGGAFGLLFATRRLVDFAQRYFREAWQ